MQLRPNWRGMPPKPEEIRELIAENCQIARDFRRKGQRRLSDFIHRNIDALEYLQGAQDALKAELRKHAVYMEYDCPGDAPEPCGMWCKACNQHVDDDGVGDHAPDCLLFTPPQETEEARPE